MDYVFISSRKYIDTGLETPLEYLWGLSKVQALVNLERMRQVVKRSDCSRILSEVKEPFPTCARQIRIGEFDPDCPSRQISEVIVYIMEDIPFSEFMKTLKT